MGENIQREEPCGTQFDTVLLGLVLLSVVGVPLAFLIFLENSILIKASIYQLVALALVLGFVLSRLFSKTAPIIRSPVYLPLVVYIAILLLSAVLSRHKHHAVESLLKTLAGAALLFVVMNIINSRSRLTWVTTTVACVAAIAGIYGLVQHFDLDPVPWISRPRITATFANPNFFAAFLITVIPLFLCLYLGAKRMIGGVPYLLVGAVCILCLVLTYSRGAWLGCGASLALCGLVVAKRFRIGPLMARLLTLGVVLAVLAAGVIAGSSRVRERLGSVSRPDVGTGNVRLVVWRGALEMWKKRPVFGNGLGQFKVRFPHYRDRHYLKLGLRDLTRYAHSEYLDLLVETGVVGLCAFLAFVGVLFRHVLRRMRSIEDERLRLITLGCLAGVLGLLVHNTVSVNMRWTVGSFCFWLFAALACACANLERFRKADEAGPSDAPIHEEDRVRSGAVSRWGVLRHRPVQWGLGILGMLVWVAFASAHFRVLKANYYYQRSIFAMHRRDHRAAIAACEKAISTDKYAYGAYNTLGYAYARNGQPEKALSTFQEGDRLWPDYARVHYNMGRMQARMKRMADARESFLRAAQFEETEKVHMYLGDVNLVLGDVTAACGEYRIALTINPQCVGAMIGSGRAYEQLGELDLALEQFERAAELEPEDAQTHLLLAGVHEKRKDFKRCIAEYQEAIRLKPRDTKALMGLAAVCMRLGEYDVAVTILKDVLKIDPGEIYAHLNLGVVLQQQGDLEHAKAEYKRVLELNSNMYAVQEAQKRLRAIE